MLFLKESVEKNEQKTWIASPCPTLVNLIRTKYPHLIENLVPVHSPLGCMALICDKIYPGVKKSICRTMYYQEVRI